MHLEKLSILTECGETYTFKYVSDFVHNESEMSFQFLAHSDGKVKKAKIFMDKVVGYTFLEVDIQIPEEI